MVYPLADFPWPVWTLTSSNPLAGEQATRWAGWLNQVESERLEMIRPVLAEAGAPVGQLPEEPEALLALGIWAQQWFSSMLRSSAGDGSGVSGFVQEKPQLRLGGAWAADRPDAPGYSPSADALLHSVALDLAFLVIEAARVQRPELAWQVVHDEERERFAVTVEQSSPPFPVLRLIRDFLVQSGARPRGLRGRELRDWRSGTLYRCYERAATGKAQISESQAFPGAAEHREGSSYLLRRPKREDPPGVGRTGSDGGSVSAGWLVRGGEGLLDRAVHDPVERDQADGRRSGQGRPGQLAGLRARGDACGPGAGGQATAGARRRADLVRGRGGRCAAWRQSARADPLRHRPDRGKGSRQSSGCYRGLAERHQATFSCPSGWAEVITRFCCHLLRAI